MIKTPTFYRDKPVFGFDLGFNSIKIMQLDMTAKQPTVLGYGYATYNNKAMQHGVIVDPETIAKSAYQLIANDTIGSIDTRRVVSAVPVSRSYNRVLSLPVMSKSEVEATIKLEAEQYIPVPTDELYLDYQIGGIHEDMMEVLLVAAPRKIIDSYMVLCELLGLELALIETSINASTRLVMHAEDTDVPTLIIDFGAVSTDLSIFDSVLRVTGTVTAGGDQMTERIAKKLQITKQQARTIKTKHGIHASKKQKEIVEAVQPLLHKLVDEVKRMDRFYQDRSNAKKKIEQVIILGGGANMPGLADYLTDKIRIPARMCNPWLNMDFGNLQPPHQLEKTLYATASGLALIQPEEMDDD